MFNYIIDSINAKYSTMSNGRHVYNQTDVLNIIIEELLIYIFILKINL